MLHVTAVFNNNLGKVYITLIILIVQSVISINFKPYVLEKMICWVSQGC
jgi:hypothetical protein